MQKRNNTETEKFYQITDFSNGDWICFLLPNNKKCIGLIVEMLIPDKTNDIYSKPVKVINYLDEDGLSGSIKTTDLNKNQRIVGIDMNPFFNKKFSLKTENHNPIQTKTIAKHFVKMSKQKRAGKIINN
jgi:hypothetical protein